uniref:Uncharacterized protein n=1 Tax=Photinus pyralis TaxID=7054 RepID=A0A1Y1M8G4_PHOPY
MASKNYDACKAKVLSRSPTVQQLREDIRKQFHERLKLSRQGDTSRNRNLFKNAIGHAYQTFRELKSTLLNGGEEEPTVEEMALIWDDIEGELCKEFNQRQADDYALQMEAAVNENAYICSICSNIITSDNSAPCLICDMCARLYFNNDSI